MRALLLLVLTSGAGFADGPLLTMARHRFRFDVVPLVFHGVHAPVTVTPNASSGGGGVTRSGAL